MQLPKSRMPKIFGFLPETLGINYVNCFIVTEKDHDEEVDIKPGYICIVTRDGYNIDNHAIKRFNFVGTSVNWFDRETIRYYYFRPLEEHEKKIMNSFVQKLNKLRRLGVLDEVLEYITEKQPELNSITELSKSFKEEIEYWESQKEDPEE